MNAITQFNPANVVALRPMPALADVDAAVAAITPAAMPVDESAALPPATAADPANAGYVEPESPQADATDQEADEVVADLVAPPPVVTVRTVSALVARAALQAAVMACTRVVERRSTIPILANVLLRGTDTGLEVIGTDLDIVVTVPVACPVDSAFATTLPAHTLADLLKKAKASDMVAIDVVQTTTEGKHVESDTTYDSDAKKYVTTQKLAAFKNVNESVELDFAGLKLTLQGLPPADFPTMDVPAWAHTFTLATADLARALDRTEFCISEEETRYYLNGVYMHVPEHSKLRPAMLRFVATDGHQLGSAEMPAPDGCTKAMPGVIVPRKTVQELLRLAKAKGAPANVTVNVAEGGGKMQFSIGDVIMLSKAIDGTFPDYSRVIPTGNDKRLIVGVDAMDDAIKQVTVISSERGRAVRLACERDKVTLIVSNPDMGTARTTLESEYDSDPMDIGFNSQYLRSILGKIESDAVTMMLADPGSPALFTGDGDGDKGVLYVLMPMRV